ncbi:MAG: VOC family protein [Ekhidna sp.]
MSTIKITGMTIAISDMPKMVNFYQQVFKLNFEEMEMYGSKLYKTHIDHLEVLFCPASIAQNTAKQNRHQLNFEVEDLGIALADVPINGGEVMGEPQLEGSFKQIGVKDPDNNSIVLKQKITD